MSRRRRIRWIVAAVLLLVSPLALFFVARGGLAAANLILERRYLPPGQMISVGDHRLHLFCQGSGSPTVVIEPGLGVDWVSWSHIVADLSPGVEVCVYDRAGYGWSEAGPMPRSADQIAAELHQLMTASNHRRIVLVGHSFGGYVARVYAGTYPHVLAGVVLVDPSDHDPAEGQLRPPPPKPLTWSVSDLVDRLPPLGWDRVKRLYRGESALSPSQRTRPLPYRQRLVIASSLDQLEAEQSELDSRLQSQLAADAAVFPADLPFVVITPVRQRPSAAANLPPTSDQHRERHRTLAAAAPLGAQVIAEPSGHFVHVDQPALVLRVDPRCPLARRTGPSMTTPGADRPLGLTTPQIAVRLFLTCWIVYALHFATNIVREIYPAIAMGDHFSFRVDEYANMHPDLFEKPGYGWHINNNPGVSMVAAIPYALARPAIDRIVARVRRARAASGALPPVYDSPWPMARDFYAEAWRRGLDLKLGLAAFVMQAFCMAPSSALGVVAMFFVLRRLFRSDRQALGLALLYAVGTPVFFRTGYLNQNMMFGHIAFLGFIALWNPGGGSTMSARTRSLLGGVAGGACVLFDYSGIVLLVGLFVYARRSSRLREATPAAAVAHAGWVALGALGPLAILWFYQWQAFGHPFYPAQHWMPPVAWIDQGYRGVQSTSTRPAAGARRRSPVRAVRVVPVVPPRDRRALRQSRRRTQAAGPRAHRAPDICRHNVAVLRRRELHAPAVQHGHPTPGADLSVSVHTRRARPDAAAFGHSSRAGGPVSDARLVPRDVPRRRNWSSWRARLRRAGFPGRLPAAGADDDLATRRSGEVFSERRLSPAALCADGGSALRHLEDQAHTSFPVAPFRCRVHSIATDKKRQRDSPTGRRFTTSAARVLADSGVTHGSGRDA